MRKVDVLVYQREQAVLREANESEPQQASELKAPLRCRDGKRKTQDNENRKTFLSSFTTKTATAFSFAQGTIVCLLLY